MIIHWTSIHSPHKPEYSQPDPDVLRVLDTEFDFSDTTRVEHVLPEPADEEGKPTKHGWMRDYVQRAWREAGVLHLQLLAHTLEGLWADRTIDYGESEELSWSE